MISSCTVENWDIIEESCKIFTVISKQRIILSPSLAAWRTSPSQGEMMARRREGAATGPSWQWNTVSDSSKNDSRLGTFQHTPRTKKLSNDFISVNLSFLHVDMGVSVFGLLGSCISSSSSPGSGSSCFISSAVTSAGLGSERLSRPSWSCPCLPWARCTCGTAQHVLWSHGGLPQSHQDPAAGEKRKGRTLLPSWHN